MGPYHQLGIKGESPVKQPNSPHKTVKFKPTGTAKGDREAAIAAGQKAFPRTAATIPDRALGIGDKRKGEAMVGVLDIDRDKGTATVFHKNRNADGSQSFQSGTQQKARKARKK